MKIRIGFVSNSSTSSFITIISDRDFEKVLKELSSDINRKIIHELVKDEIVAGVLAKVLTGSSSSDDVCPQQSDLSEELQEDLDEDYDIFHEAIYEYKNVIKNHPNGFYHSEDI